MKGNRWDAWLETIEEREVNTTQANENNSYHKKNRKTDLNGEHRGEHKD